MLSIIVPCYNEQEALPLFHKEATRVLSLMKCDYELLILDDGSSDGTLDCLRDLGKSDSHVHYFSLSRNFGKEAAMYAGFCNAKGDYVAVMDSDLQDPPSLLPEMLEILESQDYDCVAARRVNRTGEKSMRSWFARRFYGLINRIADTNIAEGARDFRLMKRDMAQAIVALGERSRFSKGLFEWVGFKTYWLSYENSTRVAGDSKWSTRSLFKYAFDGIISFSEVPLSIASWFGMLVTIIAFVFLAVIIIRKLCFGDPVAGWASTICAILFIGGIQMFFMGVIGQYLAKTYTETKKRPHFIIAETNDGAASRIQ